MIIMVMTTDAPKIGRKWLVGSFVCKRFQFCNINLENG
jgi:hypothetical protein